MPQEHKEHKALPVPKALKVIKVQQDSQVTLVPQVHKASPVLRAPQAPRAHRVHRVHRVFPVKLDLASPLAAHPVRCYVKPQAPIIRWSGLLLPLLPPLTLTPPLKLPACSPPANFLGQLLPMPESLTP